MPQNNFDPNQPITIANAWPYLAAFLVASFYSVRKTIITVVSKLVELEYKKPLAALTIQVEALVEEIKETKELVSEHKITETRFEEQIKYISEQLKFIQEHIKR